MDHGTFDPEVVGSKIKEHIAAADLAGAEQTRHAKEAGKLLVDVAKNHHQHLETICKEIGLSRSRRAELMQIAGGRRTVEQMRAAAKARVDRHRAKKQIGKFSPHRLSNTSHSKEPSVTAWLARLNPSSRENCRWLHANP